MLGHDVPLSSFGFVWSFAPCRMQRGPAPPMQAQERRGAQLEGGGRASMGVGLQQEAAEPPQLSPVLARQGRCLRPPGVPGTADAPTPGVEAAGSL